MSPSISTRFLSLFDTFRLAVPPLSFLLPLASSLFFVACTRTPTCRHHHIRPSVVYGVLMVYSEGRLAVPQTSPHITLFTTIFPHTCILHSRLSRTGVGPKGIRDAMVALNPDLVATTELNVLHVKVCFAFSCLSSIDYHCSYFNPFDRAISKSGVCIVSRRASRAQLQPVVLQLLALDRRRSTLQLQPLPRRSRILS